MYLVMLSSLREPAMQTYRLGQTMIRPRILLGLLILACQSTCISAEELRCKNNDIVVQGTKPQDAQDGCAAALDAAQFFASSGLAIPKGVLIELVDDQLGPLLAPHETGTYDAKQNLIRVLSYDAAVKATRANSLGLGRIATRAHWRSYIVHELTHAAVHAGCDKTCPSRATHEYLAAVAQLSSIPGNQLTKLLTPYRNLDPFKDLSEISETYYAINPHYFAVKSYKHYLRLSDPRAFFRDTLHLSD